MRIKHKVNDKNKVNVSLGTGYPKINIYI
jgi:prefoldin subunit 5